MQKRKIEIKIKKKKRDKIMLDRTNLILWRVHMGYVTADLYTYIRGRCVQKNEYIVMEIMSENYIEKRK